MTSRPHAVVCLVLCLLALTPVPASAATYTLFAPSDTPLGNSSETSPIELGMRFEVDTPGWVSGVRFYKAVANTGTHTGTLWTDNGTVLATGEFTGETDSGWQQMTFGQAIQVMPGQVYVVSYHTTTGHYSYAYGAFASGITSGPLHALANTPTSPNGVFVYSNGGTFPTDTWNGGNYYVDVVYSDEPPTPDPDLAPSVYPDTTVPTVPSSGDGAAVEVGAKFRASQDGWVYGVRFYKGAGNTGPHVGNLWAAASHTLLASAPFVGETALGWQTQRFDPPVRITANTTYVISYHAPNGHYAWDLNGLISDICRGLLCQPGDTVAEPNGVHAYSATSTFPDMTWGATNYYVDVLYTNSVNPPAPPPLPPAPPPAGSHEYTLYPKGAAPRRPLEGNNESVELGVRFRSDVPGYVRGIRFFKGGAANSGTHFGRLYKGATGERLANAEFVSESLVGWQEVRFAWPVHIDANTEYVASYFAPNGGWSATWEAFTDQGVDSRPLHAPRSGNGVFHYGPLGGFPDQSFRNTDYGVDVVFSPEQQATKAFSSAFQPDGFSSEGIGVELGLKFTVDRPATALAVRFLKAVGNTGTHVGNVWNLGTGQNLGSVTFTSETSAGWQEAKFATPVPLEPGVTYVVSYYAPNGHYAYSRGWWESHSVSAGALRVAQGTGTNQTSIFHYGPESHIPTESFANSDYAVDVVVRASYPVPSPAPSPARDNKAGTGPVLVAMDPDNHFTEYLPELLKAEGINSFVKWDAGNLGAAADLAGFTTVILGEGNLGSAQLAALTEWVNAGGTLIAMRPKPELDALLGISRTGATLAEGYIDVHTGQAPGAGIVDETMQYHGVADVLVPLAGTDTVAGLYQDASTAVAGNAAAVTLRSVGAGRAAAFAYDLARSVVYTRQGNPAWAKSDRDRSYLNPGLVGSTGRADDMFIGDSFYDDEADWVDLDKLEIPQADEQQRLLVNLMNLASQPLPRLWYLPNAREAAFVYTGDGHPGNNTLGRLQELEAASPVGCSVADWECYRMTIYGYAPSISSTGNLPLTDAEARAWEDKGFELAMHLSTNCGDYDTKAWLDALYDAQLDSFNGVTDALKGWPSVRDPRTVRTHCIAWSDWTTQADVELEHGIRLDTNYYAYPGNWLQDRPGLFTGSGFAMRFAHEDGTPVDVYQAATQFTDESGQTYPLHVERVLDNALQKGFYGTFVANLHVDNGSFEATASLAALQARPQVAVISAAQLLDWNDAREHTRVTASSWNGTALAFDLGTPAHGLSLMLPATRGTKSLTTVTRDGASVTVGAPKTIKGVAYVFVNAAAAGHYVATYD
ncbi:DUF4082 domain-containing protein [Pyxidicoccus sp. MSG2]|uniref:DUF4082 domain-containing protein n=1 Tax=Pyxidicoccus sp. MSG2 TaxID=2996790 RepID=UPI00226D5E43|nr:DUF4082 domain-containing protein [Pyxidicoccus sp. MSG2]MCY1019592.1 DUF4082 domain-containing protein [Pyxidicoccus sp. MSG2]